MNKGYALEKSDSVQKGVDTRNLTNDKETGRIVRRRSREEGDEVDTPFSTESTINS